MAPTATIADTLAHLRATDPQALEIATICVVDDERRYLGAVSFDELLLSDPGTHLGDLLRGGVPSVTTDADLPEVAMLMTDYNLIALPVVDADGRPVGLIGVDDVLEQVLPDDWRRRGGSARD
jgi:Mg/Co/Ni transporter MgtE